MAKMQSEQMGTGKPYSKPRTVRVQRDAQGRFVKWQGGETQPGSYASTGQKANTQRRKQKENKNKNK